jgi:hypothetical protein
MKTDGPSGDGCGVPSRAVQLPESRQAATSGQRGTSCVSCALTILWAPEIGEAYGGIRFWHPMSRMAATIEAGSGMVDG